LKKILLVILILLPLALAEVENYNNYSILDLEISQEISAELQSESSSSTIKEAKMIIHFFPKDDSMQNVEEIKVKTEPSASLKQSENQLEAKWDSFESELIFKIDSKVKTKNGFIKIENKISFPPDFPSNLDEYTKATQNIDITSEIKEKANELVEGESDYYTALIKIANFVKEHVEYDLNPSTKNSLKPASWVYNNKKGACDEISNLYLSLLRSLKIPSRFVSGVVYSNKDYSFGNHGWVEVYFPKYGWVPFDVTYGQYGWIDPSHVKMMVSKDPSEGSLEASWTGRDVTLATKPIEIDTEVTSAQGSPPELLEVSLKPLKNEVKPGSYMVVEALVKNNNPYYVPFYGVLTKAPGILNNKTTKQNIINPRSQKNIYYIIHVPDHFEKDKIYTSILELKTMFGDTAESNIRFTDEYNLYDLEWAEETFEKLESRSEKEILKEVSLDCSADKKKYYQEEEAIITCNVENKGNVRIESLQICLKEDCKKKALSINEGSQVSFNYITENREILKISAEDEDTVTYSRVVLSVIELPGVHIEEISPKEARYNQETEFNILLSTDSKAYNPYIQILDYHLPLQDFEDNYEAKIKLNSKSFYKEPMFVNITYHDELGKPYSSYKKTNIEITNVPWYVRWFPFLF